MYKKVSHRIICNKETWKLPECLSVVCISTTRQTYTYIHETMFMVHCAALQMCCRAEKRDDACYKDVIYLPMDARLKEHDAVAQGRSGHSLTWCSLPLALGSLQGKPFWWWWRSWILALPLILYTLVSVLIPEELRFIIYTYCLG